MITSKTEIRAKYKCIRDNITFERRYTKSRIIRKKFFDNFDLYNHSNYFVYNSFGAEVATGDIITQLIKKGKNVFIPKCKTDTCEMWLTRFCADDIFEKNSYGISESNTDDYFAGNIDVILLPLITADVCGNRIGYGKGYYDRFINAQKNKPILIGLAFSEQISDEILPGDKHDAKLDYIVTDTDFIKINIK